MEETTMVESPLYNVEKKEDGFEIRAYAAYILAQVEVESDFDGALRNGFEILAHYIFGGNRKKEAISMTAPVSEEKVSGSEEIPMMAPVTSEKISMTAPVTEERTKEGVYRVSSPCHRNLRSRRSQSRKIRGSRLRSSRAGEPPRHDSQAACTISSQLRGPRNLELGSQGTALCQNQILSSRCTTRRSYLASLEETRLLWIFESVTTPYEQLPGRKPCSFSLNVALSHSRIGGA